VKEAEKPCRTGDMKNSVFTVVSGTASGNSHPETPCIFSGILQRFHLIFHKVKKNDFLFIKHLTK